MNPVAWLISIPLASAPLIYLMGHGVAGRRPMPFVNGRMAWWLSLGTAIAMWAVLVQAARDLQTSAALTFTVGGLKLVVDGLSLVAMVVALSITTLVILYSGPTFAHRTGAEKYYAMLMTTTGAMMGMTSAHDLFNLWVWFEALVVASFLLIAFHHQRPAALDASVKYLVQSAVGSLLVMIGIALVLGQTGALALDGAQRPVMTPALLAAGMLFAVGFGIKCALVPLHTWLPDVYTEAPSGTSALLSGAVTVSGLIALARALTPLADGASIWGALLMGFGVVNMLAGNLLALRQTEIKRLLAYSSIAHIGYIVLGVGIGLYTGQAAAPQAGLFHLLTHGVMKPLAFLAVGAVLFSLGRAEDRRSTLQIAELRGLIGRYPLPGWALLLAILSLAGLPPLAGFASKWQIFMAGFASGDPLAGVLVIFAVLNILLAMGYYLPVTMALFQPAAATASPRRALPDLIRMPLVLLMALILIIGLYPDLVRGLTGMASAALMSIFSGGSVT
jgi:proton-translocating NADH-quinone oxidoreductase chain N